MATLNITRFQPGRIIRWKKQIQRIQAFLHVAIIFGILLGLAIARNS